MQERALHREQGGLGGGEMSARRPFSSARTGWGPWQNAACSSEFFTETWFDGVVTGLDWMAGYLPSPEGESPGQEATPLQQKVEL